ncbi:MULTISPECIES: nicotinate (nicotinamide) nucleotide adenylyltransferase [unclassified Massilia]|uniref:nicotinate (nicotinamide) nucleotide adenylyltransferase n=1 Tax=unclassified Massilia TaxID=2609279 RepID=UPI001E509A57|nr:MULTISPECIES: nicotinate (nicotinamide) nucleotide adenylyltransferase [unclassified Massilia]
MTACVALLGGSFDPVHHGHIALARLFFELLHPDQLRVLPARPWQKAALQASDEDRVAMLELAFCDAGLPVIIDRQEIDRGAPSYTVETLRGLRAELGPAASIVFIMGADQLQKLDSWRDWQALFGLANLAVAARPGYTLDQDALPQAVARELAPRLATPEQVSTTPAGLVCLAHTLAVDISATQVRAALKNGALSGAASPSLPRAGAGAEGTPEGADNSLVSRVVLDYIQHHNLYKS